MKICNMKKWYWSKDLNAMVKNRVMWTSEGNGRRKSWDAWWLLGKGGHRNWRAMMRGFVGGKGKSGTAKYRLSGYKVRTVAFTWYNKEVTGQFWSKDWQVPAEILGRLLCSVVWWKEGGDQAQKQGELSENLAKPQKMATWTSGSGKNPVIFQRYIWTEDLKELKSEGKKGY